MLFIITRRYFDGKRIFLLGNSFIFTVITSEAEDAVTQGPVSVVVCGSKGSTGQLTLGPPSCGMFAKGSREEFEVRRFTSVSFPPSLPSSIHLVIIIIIIIYICTEKNLVSFLRSCYLSSSCEN